MRRHQNNKFLDPYNVMWSTLPICKEEAVSPNCENCNKYDDDQHLLKLHTGAPHILAILNCVWHCNCYGKLIAYH